MFVDIGEDGQVVGVDIVLSGAYDWRVSFKMLTGGII